MESDIGKIATNAKAPGASGGTVTMPHDLHRPDRVQVQMPERPKVEAPKAVEIKYDPNQARANLSSAINMLNEQMASTKRGLGFSYDSSKNSAVIKVTDLNSGNVVRQIPSEDILKMAHHIDAMKGILYNKIA